MLRRISIRRALSALAIGMVGLLVLLLVEDILLLNKLDNALGRDNELATAMLASSDALSETGDAISHLRNIALTGDLESDAQARALLAGVNTRLGDIALGEDSRFVEDLRRKLADLGPLGVQMSKAYLLEGREAGNRLMYEPETGFKAVAGDVLGALQENSRAIRGQLQTNSTELAAAGSQARSVLIATTTLLLVLVPLAIYLLYRKIIGSTDHIIRVVETITAGDYSARCRLGNGDELHVLATAFDRLLDERVEQFAEIQKENDSLNNSIIRILEATGDLANRDLRINVPVTDDVTGAISDSINGAVADIAEVLNDVRGIAERVKEGSASVDRQANTVSHAADMNLSILEKTLEKLSQASTSMAQVVELADRCQVVAAEATSSTEQGLSSVLSTTEGMSRIRESIQETSKRIKRLGERSQEISGIVGIIKDIAERTHVLALNARIQASSAGEAGRGFSVVAEEVKTLADSSRKATDQIASLIHNIQLETNDTIATMEKAVSEVVSGAELSEQARQQMVATRTTANVLADVVQQIAGSSARQAELTGEIADSADVLRQQSLETHKELTVQREQSANLAGFAEQLTRSVAVFQLPQAS
ncbi:methyl-accepting chemotaxis protein [Thiocystis violacea]|uniref:methyl-accepting chemotaxis protein n=1 Tax=Thiocystis violacea TaxID=13725 RepID=UPI001905F1AF|nr:methyl-accepting chemotaxis protein [Thiocystis violacea]MBK1722953.1 hypothetical protein [Thiocystis violacea]